MLVLERTHFEEKGNFDGVNGKREGKPKGILILNVEKKYLVERKPRVLVQWQATFIII
jgi:hypothetical protein